MREVWQYRDAGYNGEIVDGELLERDCEMSGERGSGEHMVRTVRQQRGDLMFFFVTWSSGRRSVEAWRRIDPTPDRKELGR